MLILVAFGTVDVGFMLFEWAQASKAAYVGAHRAIVSDPVASSIKTIDPFPDKTQSGLPCFNAATGALDTTRCTLVTKTCTGDGGGCADFDSTAFNNIFTS